MKKILITGNNSYIGNNLKNKLDIDSYNNVVEKISLKNEEWKGKKFSDYDVVIHLAAIVHKKETKKNINAYFEINKELAIEVAEKAKDEEVPHLIFMSTMAVYGEDGKLNEKTVIDHNTKPNPKTYYGKSKLEAEKGIKKLADSNFKVAIVRPPMVYGQNSPGNYASLEKVARKSPIFPLIENYRSVVHIDKLCMDLIEIIYNKRGGLFLPQDEKYVNTSELVKNIAEKSNKKIYLSPLLGKVIRAFFYKNKIIKKIFGTLIYKTEK